MICKKAILLLSVVAFSCSETKDRYTDYQAVKTLAEDSTDRFGPGLFNSSHSVVVFKIKDYHIMDSTIERVHTTKRRFSKTVAGPMPSMRNGGTFQVVITDSANNAAYSYQMTNPLYQRIEHAGRKGVVRIRDGAFEVPVPTKALPRCTIILKDNGVEQYVSAYDRL